MREENRIVHGLWIGELTRLELLTVHSFAAHGHKFHLWRYEDTPEQLPSSVLLRDANEILPYERVFRKRDRDPDSGLGQGSYATFSDLFRVRLLNELGGIWVDMDVVCLRPFDFVTPYIFRGHRVGAVMNLIKCPARSPLMIDLLERSEQLNEDSTWLGFTRAFYESIVRNGLDEFIRWDLMPADSWQTIKPLIEGDSQPDDGKWYAIHLLNEMWKELQRNGGVYKGIKIADRAPDKNHPSPGTTLFQWYEKYDLFRRAWAPVREPENIKNGPAARQPLVPGFTDMLQLNATITSMSLGGAERIVSETVSALGAADVPTSLYLLHDAEPGYPLEGIARCQVTQTAHLPREGKLRLIAAETALSPTPAVFAHLLRASDLEPLAQMGTAVIPVVHNAQPGWFDPPAALNQTSAPFVVAVSEAVKRQLLEFGCAKPIVVIRHEIQRKPVTPEQATRSRITLRRHHAVPNGTLLIGMVGAFKAQKMYTRAIRVLAALQKYIPARLMILGEWNHDWGDGRAAYSGVWRQAVELEIAADVILPGAVDPVDPYYCAFDVYLSTSLYEGLSVSVLEAIAHGCPVVTPGAGGNGEVLTANDQLVSDASDIEAYVDAILEVVARSERTIPAARHDPDLVPHLWALLGKHGMPRQYSPRSPSVLVVTENLNIGGPQRSLTNLLTHWPGARRAAVAVLDACANGPYVAQLEDAGIAVIALKAGSLGAICRRTLELADRFGATTLAFWNAPPAFKLTCAKILEARKEIRLVDVSPGPMLFDELGELGDVPHRIGFSVDQYFSRIDCFVAKHQSGAPPGLPADRVRIIPNGVPIPHTQATLSEPIVGAACRIVPSKRVEYLIDMMDVLVQRMPHASLTIAGGFDPRHEVYANYVRDKFVAAGLNSITFAGPLQDVQPFLESLSVFAMISEDQGCPNASLEAMAMGVPVVANPSGGTAEQIDHGVNGFLIDENSPRSMASAIEKLLREDDLRLRMGAAARNKVAESFSIESMVLGYLDAFFCFDPALAELPGALLSSSKILSKPQPGQYAL